MFQFMRHARQRKGIVAHSVLNMAKFERATRAEATTFGDFVDQDVAPERVLAIVFASAGSSPDRLCVPSRVIMYQRIQAALAQIEPGMIWSNAALSNASSRIPCGCDSTSRTNTRPMGITKVGVPADTRRASSPATRGENKRGCESGHRGFQAALSW